MPPRVVLLAIRRIQVSLEVRTTNIMVIVTCLVSPLNTTRVYSLAFWPYILFLAQYFQMDLKPNVSRICGDWKCSVWSSLPPINASASSEKSIVLAVSSMDSASFFRDNTVGADSPLSVSMHPFKRLSLYYIACWSASIFCEVHNSNP